MSAKTTWRIAGESIGSCNCAWGCPCQFNALPTHRRCEGTATCRIDKGHFGDVRLDGVTFAGLYWFPGAVHEGNGVHQLIIDERASPEQRRIIAELDSGVQGGAFFEIFAAVCPNRIDALVAPITVEIDRVARTGRVSIPGILESRVQPIRNPVTGQEHHARIQLPFGFEYKEAEMGNTVHWKSGATGVFAALEHHNTYAQLTAFDWTNL